MNAPTKCECEHERHFRDEPEGGAYGHIHRSVTTYRTDFGPYQLCGWCWDVCHGARLSKCEK